MSETTIIVITIFLSVLSLLFYNLYRLKFRLEKFEKFIDMRNKLKSNDNHMKIIQLLEENNEDLKNIPLINKYNFLGFYEEIAILVNNRLMNEEIAFYMFGYYAIKCMNASHFWSGINQNSFYWILFNNFASKMITFQDRFLTGPLEFKI